MAQRGADAVRPGVAAADHDHVLAFGADVVAVGVIRIEQAARVRVQILHREVDAREFASRNRQVARNRRAGRKQHGVIGLAQRAHVERAAAAVADLGGRLQHDALGAQQVDAAIDEALVELHVRNAVHQQSADAIRALVHGDEVSGLIQLGRRRQTGRARSR